MMMIHYFDLEGKIEAIPSVEQIEACLGISPVIWQCNIKEGDILSKVSDGHSLMGRGYFVLEGKCEEELKERAEKIKSLFF